MNEILSTIGYRPGFSQKVALFGVFAFVTLACVVTREAIGYTMGLSLIVLQVISWAGWFVWQGQLFPRNWERLSGTPPQRAYRQAFFTHILPGVSFGIALMMQPFLHGVAGPGIWSFTNVQLLVAIILVLIGISLLFCGFRSIGLSSAGFLYEYVPHAGRIQARGIYRFIRHPLFLGGALASMGSGLLFGNPVCIWLGIVNVLILPVYRYIEDHRLIRVLGEDYITYCRSVPAFVPKTGSVISSLFGTHGANTV
jgi:protein-S-isoprenylcysteine O-methyltransferase Ste14